MIKLGAYVLPEFGHHIADAPGKGYADQFKALKLHFGTAEAKSKAMLLTGFVKLSKRDATLVDKAQAILNQYMNYWDEDIQQRAVEYDALLKMEGGEELGDSVFTELPAFPEHLQTKSVLMKRMGEIKSSKGFSNKGEGTKSKDVTAGYKTAVSAALSKNGVKPDTSTLPDLMGSEEPIESTGDLIGLGDDPTPLVTDLDHSLKSNNPADFSPKQTVNFEP